MAPDDDEISVSTSATAASLTPSIASYMSSWSTPAAAVAAPSRSGTSRGSSHRRAGRYIDAASTTFHSRRFRRSSLGLPRVRDEEEGGAHAACIDHNSCRLLRPRRVIPAILAIVASVALFSTQPAPTYYRRLICDVVFDYSQYAGYSNWEDLVSTFIYAFYAEPHLFMQEITSNGPAQTTCTFSNLLLPLFHILFSHSTSTHVVRTNKPSHSVRLRECLHRPVSPSPDGHCLRPNLDGMPRRRTPRQQLGHVRVTRPREKLLRRRCHAPLFGLVSLTVMRTSLW